MVDLTKGDKKSVFVTGDLGYMALEPLQKAIGDRFINGGVAEQNLVSVAAGLARKGLTPWVYSIAPFITLRPYEQLRNDVCFHHLPVRVVGNGGGFGYGIMGSSHHSLEDIGCMQLLPHMQVFVPTFQSDTKEAVTQMSQLQDPCYLRLGKALPSIGAPPFAAWRRLTQGDRAVVLATGPIVGNLLELQIPGLEIYSVGRFPISHIPADIVRRIEETGYLITMEEHRAPGGLGECISRHLLGKVHVQALPLFVTGYPSGKYGSQNWHVEENGLRGEGLRKRVESFLGYESPSKKALHKLGKNKISAVIACYNDSQAIPIMHQRLTKVFTAMGSDYEIIFVNDGSPDNSAEVLGALTATDPHVIHIRHSRNFGSQNAFRSGMEVATGDGVVLMDGDLQDPPELIPEFAAQWKKGFDVVYGRRVKREATVFLQFAYKGFYRLFRGVADIPIPVDAGDFSLIDRAVVKQLLALPEADQFLRGLRAWVGFKQTGVNYVRPERAFGRTTNSMRKNFHWAKKAIFSFSFVPLEVLSIGGIVLTGISFLALIAQVIAKYMYPDIPHGLTTIIVLVLFFGGVQLCALSILGEYIGKIVEETKRRPHFIRSLIEAGGKKFQNAEEISQFILARKNQEA